MDGTDRNIRLFWTLVLYVLIVTEITAASKQCSYKRIPGYGIQLHNWDLSQLMNAGDADIVYDAHHETDCQAACDQRENCVSLEFKNVGRYCILLNMNLDSRPNLFSVRTGRDVYEKTACEEKIEQAADESCHWEATLGHALVAMDERELRTGGKVVVQYGVTLQQCQEACDVKATCLSLDYDDDNATCKLNNHKQAQIPDRLITHIYYDHYERVNCEDTK